MFILVETTVKRAFLWLFIFGALLTLLPPQVPFPLWGKNIFYLRRNLISCFRISVYLGKGFSIFTSELYAILMALNYICNIQLAIYNFVICVDSKSVLCALKSWNCKMRGDIFYEVKYLMHCIMYKGIGMSFTGYRLIVVFTGMKYQTN